MKNTDLPQSRGIPAAVSFDLGATCVPLLESFLVQRRSLRWGGVRNTFRCSNEIYRVVADILKSIEEQQIDRCRILTGWYLTSAQIEGLAGQLLSREPHLEVGGLGRFHSVPVFPIDDFIFNTELTETDVCDGVRFSFVQMDVIN